VQDRREFARTVHVVGEQAFDADAHVLQPAGGVDARADGVADVGGAEARGIAP